MHVAVVVRMLVIVGMIMAVRMVVAVLAMRVSVIMVVGVVMRMRVAMRMAVIVTALAVIVSLALGLEGAGDGACRAALAAHELGGGGRDIQHFGGDLGRDVAAAELPGEAQEAGRIGGTHLQQGFGGRLHENEAAILEAQGVAVINGRRLGQGRGEAEAVLPCQGRRKGLPGGMVEDDAIDDGVGADGGLTDQGGGAQHRNLGSDGLGDPLPYRVSDANGKPAEILPQIPRAGNLSHTTCIP